MGMYTGLVFEAKIREEYQWILEELFSGHNWEEINHPLAQKWGAKMRSGHIPFGGSAYLDDWSADKLYEISGTQQSTYEDGILYCQCSLKNYDQEIEFFLEQILPHLIEEQVTAYYKYEEWEDEDEVLVLPLHDIFEEEILL